jgi:predicted transposase YdaD
LSREEIQAMLQVKDIRETRVYREAMEEGKQKATARHIVNLAARQMPVEEIASALEVEIDFVREVLRGRTNGSS